MKQLIMLKSFKLHINFNIMKEILGIEIDNLGFSLIKLGDLLYHEGPLLSHFVDKNDTNRHFLYKWVECDDEFNRWLVFQVTKENFVNFFCEEKTLRELINSNPYVFFIEIDDDLNEKKITVTQKNGIPKQYLPSVDAYFNEEQFERYAIELRNEFVLNPNREDIYEIILKELLNLKKEQKRTNSILNSAYPQLFQLEQRHSRPTFYSEKENTNLRNNSR